MKCIAIVDLSRCAARVGGNGEEGGVGSSLSYMPPRLWKVEYMRVQRGLATGYVDLNGDGANGGAVVWYVALPQRPFVPQLGRRV